MYDCIIYSFLSRVVFCEKKVGIVLKIEPNQFKTNTLVY